MDFQKALARLAGKVETAEPTKEALIARAELIAAKIKEKGFDDNQANNHRILSRYLARLVLGGAEKGICIAGATGTGKTFAAMLIADYTRRKYAEPGFLAAQAFVQMSNKDGVYAALAEYTSGLKVPDWKQKADQGWWDGCTMRHADLIIDDLGSESNAAHYGVKSEALVELLAARYETFKSHGARTHITTNLTTDEIRERYGNRIESRIAEMCYVVRFDGPDRRKQKGKDQ